jgi:hypothetical protein
MVSFPESAPTAPVDPAAVVGFEPMFRYRHRKTKEILEGNDATSETQATTPE